MKTIIKKGYLKIMELFYKNKSLEIHLRDIARKTNLNENSVSRFLNQLEENHILKSRKDGNLKKYSIQKNMQTFALFLVYDLERYLKLSKIKRRVIKSFLKNLNEQPIMVFLFGSTAKGNFTNGSDIDLLLIMNKNISLTKAEDYAESQTGLRINCLQISYKDFVNEIIMKKDNVIQSAINSGYPLTNHLEYYREAIK